jgi:hypothetical protein
MGDIASESVLQQAYLWLCERRQEYSRKDDVWDRRWRREEFRPQLQAQLRAGAYRLGPVRRFHQGYETFEVSEHDPPTSGFWSYVAFSAPPATRIASIDFPVCSEGCNSAAGAHRVAQPVALRPNVAIRE